MIIPPYLKKNDLIGIMCPSGAMEFKKAEKCIATLKQWGFHVKYGPTLGGHFNYFSGTDAQRLSDFQSMLDDENIKAILFGRGGYGMSRIIDQVNFTKFKKSPKWLIGYSDITLLHTHLNRQLQIASIHGPMAGAFNTNPQSIYIQSLKKSLLGKKSRYTENWHPYNKPGIAEGELIGGNLSMLIHSIGTRSQPKVDNKILFIEEVGEYLYATDRMLHQLRRAGWFDKISALIIGSFTDTKDTLIPFGQNIDQIISSVLSPYSFPVAFNFPVGHSERNFALKIGVQFQLKVSKKMVTLVEK